MPRENLISVKITNKLGMHARPAALFVQLASKYKNCDITVCKDGKEVNGKSIMGMMMLEAGNGSEITIVARGEKSEQALLELYQLVTNRFNEE